PKGQLDWNMEGRVDLARNDGKLAIAGGALDGTLALSGSLPIPGTARVWHDIALLLRADGEKLSLEKLELHESDREVSDRTLSATGTVEIPAFHPRSATVSLKAD